MCVVDLDRQFAPHRPPSESDKARELQALWRTTSPMAWTDLFNRLCVVVLGEAGTGKTTELEMQAQRLADTGAASFSARIEDVPESGLRGSLWPESQAKYDAWRASHDQSIAWFFLDALDESKLKGKRLEATVRVAAQELGDARSRGRFIISCRVSDWTTVDDATMKMLLASLAPDSDAGEQALVVELLPLDERQIRLLAGHHRVTDVDEFIEAVREQGAWPLVERPLDVEWLSEYWRENHRLDSWRELVDFNVNKKLAERRERPSQLDERRARAGAAALAAVGTLTHRDGILVPDDRPDPHRVDSIDAAEILKDWTPAEIRELLSRGLFDEATYGRVRIHHRTVREYLAAEHLASLVESGLSVSDLTAVLIPRNEGRETVPLHLGAVAAWLALRLPQLRRKVVTANPEHVIDEGDPAALPVEERKRALTSYVQKFGDRRHVFHHFDPIGLRRFATEAVETTVRDLLGDAGTADHLRYTLLRLVERGRLLGCAGAVIDNIADVERPSEIRRAALRALAEVMSDDELKAALVGIDPTLFHDRQLTLQFLDVAFPRALSVDQVADILRGADEADSHHITGLDTFVVEELLGRMTPKQCAELLDHLVADPFEPPDSKTPDKPAALRRHLRWLGECLCKLVSMALARGTSRSKGVESALDILPRIARDTYTNAGRSVESALKDHPMVRQALFWRHVERAAAEGGFPRDFWGLKMRCPVTLGEEDAAWLELDAIERPTVRERVLAFRCLLGVLQHSDERVARLAIHDPALARHLARWREKHEGLEPHPFLRQQERQRKVRERRQERNRTSSVGALRQNLDSIRSGQNFSALLHLYQIGASRGAVSQRCLSPEKIAEEYDSELAQAAIDGLKRRWRAQSPVPVEKHPPNSTPYACILGLEGIALEVADGLDVAKLSRPLRCAAIGYGAWELNSFPKWMTRVAESHPSEVRDAYRPCLVLDYGAPDSEDPSRPNLGRMIWKLETAAEAVRRACAPELIESLVRADPPSTEMLHRVLRILATTGKWRGIDVAALAEERAVGAADDPKRFAVWWSQWLQAAPNEAMAGLESAVASRSQAPADALVLEVASCLWQRIDHRHRSGQVLPLEDNAEVLERFIRIMFQHVRPADDVRHGGVYSPGTRDHAQELRSRLLDWLANTGVAGFDAVCRLIDDPMLAPRRDWLLHLRDTLRSSHLPMSTADAVQFVCNRRFVPRSARDLLAIALGRLEDIRDDISNGEFSTGRMYDPPDRPASEESVQLFLARDLELRRRDQYQVARENQDSHGNRRDICLSHPHVDGSVTLELKIAERWSGPELRSGLCEQLIERYMRANCSRCGIYVVCSSGPKRRSWQTAERKRLKLRDFAAYLQRVADEIVRQRADLDEIAVVTIDFHES